MLAGTQEEAEKRRDRWKEAGIPFGECLCGCGRKTKPAPQTDRRMDLVRGEPYFYAQGHGNRKPQKYTEEDRGYTTPCWIWQLWKTHEGYGKLSQNLGGGKVRTHLAHRWMWEKENGPVPDGLQLDHLCSQPSCVNPDHLEPVTPAENARRSNTAILDWPTVREIRRELKKGSTHRALAEAHGVCTATISHIASGRNWRED